MADKFSPSIRSQIMARIKNKNTKIELLVRKALYSRGFRYRIHVGDFAGKPDLAFKKYNALVFIHGCFWHGHDCSLFRLPKTNTEFWEKKIQRNKEKDMQNTLINLSKGLRQLVVWECSIRGKDNDSFQKVIQKIESWILSNRKEMQVKGS